MKINSGPSTNPSRTYTLVSYGCAAVYLGCVGHRVTGTSGRLSSATANRGSWPSSWTPMRRSGLRGRPSKSDGLILLRTTRGDRSDRSWSDPDRDLDILLIIWILYRTWSRWRSSGSYFCRCDVLYTRFIITRATKGDRCDRLDRSWSRSML